MKQVVLLLAVAFLAYGQGNQNLGQTGITDAHTATWRFPESTFAALPAAASGNNGWRYTVTDCLTSACTAGSGTTKVDMRSDGTAWVVISGGGSVPTTGSGSPSNPCPTAYAYYLDTAASPKEQWYCPAAGDNWLLVQMSDQIGVGVVEFTEGTAPASPASGKQRLFIDSADHTYKTKNAAGTVSAIGGGGGGTPASPSGSYQYNNAGSFGGQAFALNGSSYSTVQQQVLECASGTIEVNGANLLQKDSAGVTQQTIAMSGVSGQQDVNIVGVNSLNGTFIPYLAMVAETVQFTGTSLASIKVSMGRPGTSTDDEQLAQTNFGVSSGNAWFVPDKPMPVVLGVGNTYTMAVGFRVTGGSGFVSLLTAGKVTYKYCGFFMP